MINNQDHHLPDFGDYGPGWSGKHYIIKPPARPQCMKELDSDPSAPTTSVASTPRQEDFPAAATGTWHSNSKPVHGAKAGNFITDDAKGMQVYPSERNDPEKKGKSRAVPEEEDQSSMTEYDFWDQELKDRDKHTRRGSVNRQDDDMNDG